MGCDPSLGVVTTAALPPLPRRPAAPPLQYVSCLCGPMAQTACNVNRFWLPRQVAVAVLAFHPEKDELAFPPGEVWGDSPFGIIRARGAST